VAYLGRSGHDVREALRIAGRIVVFDAGRIVADINP
jgi:ABC-type proline/glycine betaine transport system ATPase subunit